MGSSRRVTTGYNYYGTFAQALGVGPATRLTRISNGETDIWTGDIDQSSRDGDGKTVLTTTIGEIRFYWGRSDQLPDTLLQASQIDFGSGPVSLLVPAWPNVIYFVANSVAFGGQPVPPTLKFEFEREISLLTITAHTINSDAVIPEVIYDLLTNTMFGVGMPTAKLDAESFRTACETVITEGIGASPWLDENTSVREFVGLLLSYVDGYLRYEAGQIKMGLIRKESSAGLPVIDESTLADEPKPVNKGWNNTWNFTRLVYTDRDREWQGDAVETYEDTSNAVLTGEIVDEEIRLPFVTQRDVAKKLVKRKGLKGGIPAMTWELEVMPSLRYLMPGDLVKLSFAKRGISERVVRIQEVNRSAKDNRLVRLLVVEEITRDEANDYVPTDSAFTGIPDEFALVSTTPRLATLPAALKDDQPDGFLVACHRPQQLSEGFRVHFTWDPVQKAYGELYGTTAYPAHGTLTWWTRARNNTTWILRINFQTAADAAFVLSLLDDSGEFYCCTGRRLYKSVGSTIDQHQVDALWLQAVADGYKVAISSTELELEFTDQAFGAPAPAMETEAGQGVYPTQQCYVSRKADFAIVTGSMYFARSGGNAATLWRPAGVDSPDTDWKRYVAVPTFNAVGSQELADASSTYYDRNDTTMCPSGTLATSWGNRVMTLAESLDYAGFATAMGGVHPDQSATDAADKALYRIAYGFETESEFLLAEDTDAILGFMTATGATWYNKT